MITIKGDTTRQRVYIRKREIFTSTNTIIKRRFENVKKLINMITLVALRYFELGELHFLSLEMEKILCSYFVVGDGGKLYDEGLKKQVENVNSGVASLHRAS